MRVLVTGASGLIGSNVAAAASRQGWDVLASWHSWPMEIEGAEMLRLDIGDRKACVAAARRFGPDAIVHAAGGTSPSRYEHDPRAAELDLVGVEHTLAAARAVHARYVLVSCDWVHSGYRPPGMTFDERDLPDPVNAYGRAKLACEHAAMQASVSWLITRVGDAYGVNVAKPSGRGIERHVWTGSGLALRLVKRLRDRTPIPVPASVYRSPTYAWDYAQRLCELIARGCEGVYNTAGPRSLGRREWTELLARSFACSDELVRDGTRAAFLVACGEDPRLELPPNTALCCEKASAAIGRPAVEPEQGTALMREQLRKTFNRAVPSAR